MDRRIFRVTGLTRIAVKINTERGIAKGEEIALIANPVVIRTRREIVVDQSAGRGVEDNENIGVEAGTDLIRNAGIIIEIVIEIGNTIIQT